MALYHRVEQILEALRPVFRRQAAFEWFVLLMWGVLLSSQPAAITSYLNAIGLDEGYYHQALHWFHSSAWSVAALCQCWGTLAGRTPQCAPFEWAIGLLLEFTLQNLNFFPMVERVQKILSQWGIASRRQAEQMILDRRVRLNGEIVSLGSKVDPNLDRLEVDGKLIQPANRPEFIYILLNKPIGVVSTCHDPQHRTTVLDLLPENLRQGQGIHPVGRLDIDSTGALLLTNDGALTLSLTHPRYHLAKTYRVWIDGCPSESIIQKWRDGIMLEGKKTLPARVKVLKRRDRHSLLEVILIEGRNRQIRRIVQQLGFEVLKLHRTAIGSIQLNRGDRSSLPSGGYRFLTDFEIRFLKDRVNLVTGREAAPIQ